MKPVYMPDTDTVFKLDGGTDEDDLPVTTYVEADGAVAHGSTWELTDRERAMVARGAHIELINYGFGHPPVSLRIVEKA